MMANENDVIKREHIEMNARQIKGSQLLIVPKADQFFVLKEPDSFNSFAISFLKNH